MQLLDGAPVYSATDLVGFLACGHRFELERAALAGLEGGCQVSIGAWGRVEGGQLTLDVAVLSPDGKQRLFERSCGAPKDAVLLGAATAAILLERGAAALLVREGRETTA